MSITSNHIKFVYTNVSSISKLMNKENIEYSTKLSELVCKFHFTISQTFNPDIDVDIRHFINPNVCLFARRKREVDSVSLQSHLMSFKLLTISIPDKRILFSI